MFSIKKYYFHTLFTLLTILLFFSCARKMDIKRHEALIKTNPPENFFDDSPLDPFIKAIQENITHLRQHEISFSEYNFQGKIFQQEDYVKALEFIVESYHQLEANDQRKSKLLNIILEHFDFYRPYGREDGDSFVTSYYWPQIKGSLSRTEQFSVPLYQTPTDLVSISLRKWTKQRPTWDQDLPSKLYGRLMPTDGRLPSHQVVPFANRLEIDVEDNLKGQNLEICYVDPIDAFFIQIQGHGSVELEDGKEIHVGYAAQNGHPYASIGKFVTDVIPLEELTLDTLEAYLRSLPADEYQTILNKNPSYVFFKQVEKDPHTTLGTGVIEGRTLASDPRYFPKGALGFIQFTFPLDRKRPEGDQKEVSRLVFDQDTGGAIKGPGRFDFYWGKGKEAKTYAGKVKNHADVYYLAPKDSLMSKLTQASSKIRRVSQVVEEKR